jgi:hypothetical protein
MVVELDLPSHRPGRLDKMRLVREHQSWIPRIEDPLGERIEHPVGPPAIERPNDCS